MKILHIVPTYFPAWRQGGPILSVHQLNKWLVKKGVDVTVYTTNIDGAGVLDVPLNQPVDVDGVQVYYFPVTFRPWQYSRALHQTLAKNVKNFDLVHITSTFLFASTLGAYYAKKFNKPYIISPRGSLMTEPLAMKSPLKKRIYLCLIEKRNLAGESAIHFTVEKEKEEYLAAGLPLKKSFIIPNGLDTEEFQSKDVGRRYIGFREKFGIGKDHKIILFLSRLNWKKGLDTLIPAFAEVIKKEPKAVLVIAGGDDEGYKEKIIKIIEEINFKTSDVQKLRPSIFGTSDVQKIINIRSSQDHRSCDDQNINIIFTGMLLGEDKIAAYRESDVFVLPSYSENFGMAVAEAMASGLPVVITKGIGISKEVERASAGLVVEKDINQVAEAILKILNNPVTAKKMGQRGRRLVEEEFSGDKVAEKFIEEYNKLINL